MPFLRLARSACGMATGKALGQRSEELPNWILLIRITSAPSLSHPRRKKLGKRINTRTTSGQAHREEKRGRIERVAPSLGFTFRAGRARSGASEQFDILLVEFFFVEILLNLDKVFAHAGLLAGGPGKRVTVAGAVINVDVDIEFL